jgi:hypothetical protein
MSLAIAANIADDKEIRTILLGRSAHFGGCRPGQFSHPLACEALSACRARRISRSRAIPGGVPRASLRSFAASSESRFSSVSVVLKGRRSCMALFPFDWGGERNWAFSLPVKAAGLAVTGESVHPAERKSESYLFLK